MRTETEDDRLMLFQATSLEAARGKPLYRMVEEHLRDLVISGRLIPGDLIPSESQLAKVLNVSPGTVKKAIDNLVWEGLLFRHQGKGTYVSKVDFEKSLFRFFSYGDQEGRAVRIHKETTLREMRPGPPDVCKRLGLEPDSSLVYIERVGLIGETPILLEHSWWSPTAVPGLEKPDIHIPDLLYALVLERFGVPIIRAEETLTAGAADERTAKAIRVKKGTPVVVLRRVAYSRGDQAVEVRTTYGRADRFSYKTEIR